MPEPSAFVRAARTASTAPVQRAQLVPRTVASEALLRGAREIQISHRGTIYRLLETRAGKLLLNR